MVELKKTTDGRIDSVDRRKVKQKATKITFYHIGILLYIVNRSKDSKTISIICMTPTPSFVTGTFFLSTYTCNDMVHDLFTDWINNNTKMRHRTRVTVSTI